MNKKNFIRMAILDVVLIIAMLAMSFVMFRSSRPLGIVFMCISAVLLGFTVFFSIKEISYLKKRSDFVQNALNIRSKSGINNIPVAAAVCDTKGNAVCCNDLFMTKVCDGKSYPPRKFFLQLISYIGDEKTDAQYNGEDYTVFIGEISEQSEQLYVLYFFDDTYYKGIVKSYNETRPVIITVSIDAADEVASLLSHSDYTVLRADIEKMITEWFSSRKCLFRKTGDNTFFAVTETEHLNQMTDEKFDITDKVREHLINGNPSGMSLSIGVGTGGSVTECENYSRQALDMAKGRGGDQTAVKCGDTFRFFGGVSSGVEKKGQIQTRLVAESVEKYIRNASNVIVMGHKNSDFDSIGSAIGIARIASSLNKSVNIVTDEKTSLALPLIRYFNDNSDNKELFISPYIAEQLVREETLLVITDVMRPALTECPELIRTAENTVVIDHHRMSVDRIENSVVFYHEPTASSTSEMVTELFRYITSKPVLTKTEAESLLAGIYLDTKSFTLKSGVRTFKASAYLKDRNADTVAVRKLFSETSSEYEIITGIVSSAEFRGKCAVAVTENKSPDIRLCAAKAADKLLDVENVDASFVVFVNADRICVSARSYGRVNVQLITEELGGGGHQTMAAAAVEGKNMKTFLDELYSAINKYT